QSASPLLPYTTLFRSGRAHIYARQDRLIVALEGQELGRLLYQGGNTFVASWDHGTRIVSSAGDVPVEGFTVSRRKRVLMYRRVERTTAPAARHDPARGPAHAEHQKSVQG